MFEISDCVSSTVYLGGLNSVYCLWISVCWYPYCGIEIFERENFQNVSLCSFESLVARQAYVLFLDLFPMLLFKETCNLNSEELFLMSFGIIIFSLRVWIPKAKFVEFS